MERWTLPPLSRMRLFMKYEDCIGCGQCVSTCPQGALHLVARERPPKVFRDNDALYRRINAEAMLGLVVRKIKGQ